MRIFTKIMKSQLLLLAIFGLTSELKAQTPAFPGAMGFGRYATGARGVSTRQVYLVTNLNNSGSGSFRDAVSQPGRIVVFRVGGIINLSSDVVVSPNVTIAGQTAPGTGIVLFNKRVTFSGANNVICRYLRIRLGATSNSGKDASGFSNGSNMIFDHLSVTWGMDEVFSINWDNKGNNPDNITIQNSIIGQGLHRENHSAGGLIQPSTGGKISIIRNLYTSNKTRNPKVKGVNEFVNNIVYNWGNANRLGTTMNYGWSGEAYIMGGDSAGESFVNIINNYFVGGPSTRPTTTTPFSSGNANFNLYGSGNYFDNNKNGVLDGTLVPYNTTGYPTGDASSLKTTPYNYPQQSPALTAAQAYQKAIDSVGACFPMRDEVDQIIINDLSSKGTSGIYVYRETDLPLTNGGLGIVSSGTAPADSDNDGMPNAWETANGLNPNNAADATAFSTQVPGYLNIEVYINSLVGPSAAQSTLTKQGAGSSIQNITLGSAITGFNYYWENATSATVTGLPPGVSSSLNTSQQKIFISGTPTATGVYNFTVTTVGPGASASKSGKITVTTSLQLSSKVSSPNFIKDVQVNENVDIYPNPVDNTVFITLPTGAGNSNILLLDGSGKKINSYSTHKKGAFEMDVHSLSPGVYIIQVQNDFGLKVYKMLKNK